MHKRIFLLIAAVFFASRGFAADDPASSVYQYAVPVGSATAYCWIPPRARQVRGVIVALAHILERRWLEEPIIRNMAERQGLAIIWIGPVPAASVEPALLTADMQEGAGNALQKMLSDLAQESGYEELAFAPLIPMGHADAGPFAWNATAWNPSRVIAAIPVKTAPFPISLKFQGVPVCYITGETNERLQYKNGDAVSKRGDGDAYWTVIKESALLLRAGNENNLVSVVTEPGGGQFDCSEQLAKFIALFINKACDYRLPAQSPYYGAVTLRRIDKTNGWLTDAGGMDPDQFPPALYTEYKGDPKKAYWFFDKETAMAAVAFNGDRKQRTKQMLTFLQGGNPVPIGREGFAPLLVSPFDAALNFRLEAGFGGTSTEHADGPIGMRVIAGPAVQTGKQTFRIQVDRAGMNAPVWIQLEHPGNEQYCRAVQAGQFVFRSLPSGGAQQRISFPFKQEYPLKTKKIPLHASADSQLPVSYYVVAGPAYVEKNELILTRIPEWSRFPVKITVVAYQPGSATPPLYQAAPPAIALYYIHNRTEARKHPVREQIIVGLLIDFLLHLR